MRSITRVIAAVPLHNERESLPEVLAGTLRHVPRIVVVDDGSTDGSGDVARSIPGVVVLTHPANLGYGRSLIDAFRFAAAEGWEAVVTLDADGQHEPDDIPRLLENLEQCDITSGSRYLPISDFGSRILAPREGKADCAPNPKSEIRNPKSEIPPPKDRIRINRILTRRVNRITGFGLTDAFCGFKAYRVEALKKLDLREPGYALPIELWLQAAALGLRVVEVKTRLIYRDPTRSFGGAMDDPKVRLRHYLEILRRERKRLGRAKNPLACVR